MPDSEFDRRRALLIGASGSLMYGYAAAATVNGSSPAQPAPAAGSTSVVYPRTADEIASSVVPTSLAYPPLDIRRYGAAIDGISDDYHALQSAANVAHIRGGNILPWYGTAVCNAPLVLSDNVGIVGHGVGITKILKRLPTVVAQTIQAPTLVSDVYAAGSLPSQLNACIILTGNNGRWIGKLQNLCISSELGVPGNHESQLTEFGIVSTGSISDSQIENNQINYCQYGVVLPLIFASTIRNNRANNCLAGIGIGQATSIVYHSNYANNCRTYGHSLRNVIYSHIAANAVDYLNREDFYPNRSTYCRAYIFNTLTGCQIVCNGQEQTLGTNWHLVSLRHCTFANNLSIGIGSDYSGNQPIAWLHSDGILQDCVVEGNVGYNQSAKGLLFGLASPSNHHNILFDSTRFIESSRVENNIVRARLSGSAAEGGWGK